MFKKKPVIKTISPIRTSDRRKIADQIIQDYKIIIPAAPPAEATVEGASAPDANQTLANVTAIRNSILPENALSARFSTTVGAELREVQGTVYVGAHPAAVGEERILWFKIEHGPGAGSRFYPTVYTLWHNPRLVPLLYTPELVMRKLRGGADLMTPGLANGPPFPAGAVKGAVVAVASLEKPTVPLFVGVCEIDVARLGEVQGQKGHAVRGVHWSGDELWAWSSSAKPGQLAPEALDGWDSDVRGVEEGVNELNIGTESGDEHSQDGGVSLGDSPEDPPESVPAEQEIEPTSKEIEMAFVNAFLYSLYQLKKDSPHSPNHGLSLPVQPSALISNLITPYLPIHSPQQAQYYQMKKTSWKTVKKFIKHLDKELLVKSKDRNGQETIILDVDFDDHRVDEFVPYKLPPKIATNTTGKSRSGKQKSAEDGEDPSVSQTITVQTLYRPSGKLMPTLFPTHSHADPRNYYKHSDVLAQLDKYLTSQDPPIISAENPRIIGLNPFLANTVFTSSSTDDLATIARGKATRDALLRRLLEDPTLCAPFYVILKQNQTIADVKPKAGVVPRIAVTIERRTSNKTVTKISGVEVFGIIPNLLAEELQKKCASSTSVGQATGAVKGIMEVLVQGDHRNAVEAALVKRGVKSQWIDVVDKSKKKK